MIGHYKRSKYLAEQAVREMIERAGLPAVIVNPSAPIGPRDVRPTPTGRVVLEAAFATAGLDVWAVGRVTEGSGVALDAQ